MNLPPILRFRAGRTWLGWPASQVEQVLAWTAPTPIPRSPATLVGLIAHDTRVLTVVDVAAMLDLPPDPAEPSRLLLVKMGGETVALVVHEVRSVAQPEPAPDAAALHSNEVLESAAQGPGRIGEQLLWVLSPDRVCARATAMMNP